MLVQIHIIQNHAPSNLNRDDTGSPKEAVFGGVNRARISSQCLKRSIRRSLAFQEAFGTRLGVRSRRFPKQLSAELVRQGCSENEAAIVTPAIVGLFKRDKGSGQDSDNVPEASVESGETGQIVFYSPDDVSILARHLRAILAEDPDVFSVEGKDAQRNERRRRLIGYLATRDEAACPVDMALFGRMTTTVLFVDVQASVQVAHAISTTKVEHQFDYFTAVEDLKTGVDDDQGAAMIGDVEFNSATYYKYFNIDYSALAANLDHDEVTARKAAAAFLRAALLTTPTGKQNAFAAPNPPDAVLVEVSESHVPVSYANAFVNPVRGQAGKDVVEVSVQRLSAYAADLGHIYGLQRQRAALTTRSMSIDGAETIATLDDLVNWLTARLSVVAPEV